MSTSTKGEAQVHQQEALSSNDPTSFSNPEDVYAEKLDIKWRIKFEAKAIVGTVTYHIVRQHPNIEHITFDTRDLTVKSIKNSSNVKMEYTTGEQVKNFGKPLKIKLPALDKDHRCTFTIEYETSGSSCLLWLPAEQTSDKTHPFLFSQGQPINMRNLIPCQDTPSTKATYESEVSVPKDFRVLMSAMPKGKATPNDSQLVYKFEQKVPVPSYLIAIAVGRLEGVKVGPRTTVFAEPSVVKEAAFEFGETEDMIQAAEKFAGPYVWGDYNILVLPGSFPFGGMENPCITFTTPTLLAGDRSLTDILAHEIAHSWSGNLVCFKTFEHFWLSEGFTVYLERRIMGFMHGEHFRQFHAILGQKALKECIQNMGATNPDTKLVPDLGGLDPDEVYSDVPYEKGFTLLYYLEQKVGGMDEFGAFLRHYFEINKFKSIDTETFKTQFIEYFRRRRKSIDDIEWDEWFFTPGMPYKEMIYDNTLAKTCIDLKNRWKSWDGKGPCPFSKRDLERFEVRSAQLQEFLNLLLDDPTPFEIEKVKAMQATYEMDSIKNCEIRFRWYRLCVRAKWIQQLPPVLKFITDYGRQRYLFPIYRELIGWPEAIEDTVATFNKTKDSMMPSTQHGIAKIFAAILLQFIQQVNLLSILGALACPDGTCPFAKKDPPQPPNPPAPQPPKSK